MARKWTGTGDKALVLGGLYRWSGGDWRITGMDVDCQVITVEDADTGCVVSTLKSQFAAARLLEA